MEQLRRAVAERVLLTVDGRRIPLGNRPSQETFLQDQYIHASSYSHYRRAHPLTSIVCMTIVARSPQVKAFELVRDACLYLPKYTCVLAPEKHASVHYFFREAVAWDCWRRQHGSAVLHLP